MAAKTMEEIAVILQELRFRKRLLGGLDEDDILCRLEMLQAEYRCCMEATEQRCNGLIEERDQMIRKLQDENRQLKARVDEGENVYGK